MAMCDIPQHWKYLVAGVLTGVIALLAGFHGVTMYLSAVTLSAQADVTSHPERMNSPAATAPPAREQHNSTARADTEHESQRAPELPSPTGIAAAAKAKAQAELAELEQAPRQTRRPPARRFRTPRVDPHRVY